MLNLLCTHANLRPAYEQKVEAEHRHSRVFNQLIPVIPLKYLKYLSQSGGGRRNTAHAKTSQNKEGKAQGEPTQHECEQHFSRWATCPGHPHHSNTIRLKSRSVMGHGKTTQSSDAQPAPSFSSKRDVLFFFCF